MKPAHRTVKGDTAMKSGEVYTCGSCGAEVTITNPCSCKDECATFTCCGKPMTKKEPKKGCCCCS
jgi:hypothetical protein